MVVGRGCKGCEEEGANVITANTMTKEGFIVNTLRLSNGHLGATSDDVPLRENIGNVFIAVTGQSTTAQLQDVTSIGRCPILETTTFTIDFLSTIRSQFYTSLKP